MQTQLQFEVQRRRPPDRQPHVLEPLLLAAAPLVRRPHPHRIDKAPDAVEERNHAQSLVQVLAAQRFHSHQSVQAHVPVHSRLEVRRNGVRVQESAHRELYGLPYSAQGQARRGGSQAKTGGNGASGRCSVKQQ